MCQELGKKKTRFVSDEIFPSFSKDTDFRIKIYPQKLVTIERCGSAVIDSNIVLRAPTQFSVYIKDDDDNQDSNIILKTRGFLPSGYKGRLKLEIENKRNYDITLYDSHIGYILCSPYI